MKKTLNFKREIKSTFIIEKQISIEKINISLKVKWDRDKKKENKMFKNNIKVSLVEWSLRA